MDGNPVAENGTEREKEIPSPIRRQVPAVFSQPVDRLSRRISQHLLDAFGDRVPGQGMAFDSSLRRLRIPGPGHSDPLPEEEASEKTSNEAAAGNGRKIVDAAKDTRTRQSLHDTEPERRASDAAAGNGEPDRLREKSFVTNEACSLSPFAYRCFLALAELRRVADVFRRLVPVGAALCAHKTSSTCLSPRTIHQWRMCHRRLHARTKKLRS